MMPLRDAITVRDAKHDVDGQFGVTTKEQVIRGLILGAIVGVHDLGKRTFPIYFGIIIQVTQHSQQGAVKALHLTVPLRVVRGGVRTLDATVLLEVSK